jgi:carbonic anhydrase
MSATPHLLDDGPTATERFIRGILPENPTFRQMLGMCPVLAVTGNVYAALGMAVSTTFVMIASNVLTSMLRSLIKSVNQLEVDRIAIVHHTDCGAAKIDLPGLRAKVLAATGSDPDNVDFHLIGDHAAALDADIEAVRTCPYLPVGTAIAGFLYDVATGIAHPHDSTFVG